MRNLKKMLSLVMALAMVASFMVVGASAQFSDDKDIQNKDAVETLVSLGVIKGRDTGAFDPAGIVTRAEMAKMICVAMAGGKDPTMAGIGMYPDTKNHWAAGYIDYCTNMGYVAGNPDGNFYPDKTVTGTEAAKMILTIIGYNAETENFVNNANWEININAIASAKGIYNDVSVIPNQGLTRDNAAQMIYNGLDAKMVEYKLVGIVGGNGVAKASEFADERTILSTKFDMVTGYGILGSVSYTDKKFVYGIARTDGTLPSSVKTSKDFSELFGQQVRVLWKDDSKKTVYGIYPYESAILASGHDGDLSSVKSADTSIKVDGTSIKLDEKASETPVVYNMTGDVAGTLNANVAQGPYAVKLIDVNDNGKADLMVVSPFTVAKVTYLGKDSITLDKTLGNMKLEDVSVYENVAKDDIVLFTDGKYTATGDDTITAAEVSSATVEGQKTASGEVNYKVDGDWLVNKSGTTLNNNDTIDYVAFGGILYYAKVSDSATAGTGSLAMVYAIGDVTKTGTTKASVEIKLIFADGTKKTGGLAMIDGKEVKDASDTALANGKDYMGNASPLNTKFAANVLGELVYYKVNSDGDYELKTFAAGQSPDGKVLGYTGTGATDTYTDKDADLGGKEIADSAVIFVYNGNGVDPIADGANKSYVGSAKIYSGKELKNSTNFTGAPTLGAASLYGSVNGFVYAQVGAVKTTTDTKVTIGSNYGYLTADVWTSESGSDTIAHIDMWTESGDLSVTAKNVDDVETLTAGTVVTYDIVDASTVKNVIDAGAKLSYVTGYDDANKIQINGTINTKITNDTVILFVDSENTKGESADGRSLAIADKPEKVYIPNVLYVAGNDKDFALIIADVNNKMTTDATLDKDATKAQIEAALASGTVTLDVKGMTSSLNVDVAKGQTLAVTDVDSTNALNVTIANGGTLDISNLASDAAADMLVATVKAGATLITDNMTLIGPDGLLTSTGDITVNSNAKNIKVAMTGGTVTVNSDIKIGANDTITVSGTKVVGAYAGVKLVLGSAVGGLDSTNFYDDTTDGTADSAGANSYTWTTFTVADKTYSGWVK